MRTSRLLLLLVGVTLALGVGVVHVFAHADYESSTPAKDEVVPAAPAQVDVIFGQEVVKIEGQYYVRVFNDQDEQVSTPADGTVDDLDRTHISATLQTGLPDGRYIVRWMTTSFEDGDTDEGAFCFYVAVEPTAAQQAECAAFDEDGEPTGAASVTPGGTTEEPTAVATVSESPQPSPTTIAPSDDDDDPPVAAIVGAIIGGAVVLGIVAAGVFIWLRRTLA
jgi:methionine-rich copper-binding protein CopC